jgi:hypothetical protein
VAKIFYQLILLNYLAVTAIIERVVEIAVRIVVITGA